MTAAEIERFRRIESIFDTAVDHAAGPAREAWLRSACGADHDLFAEVSAFLLDHEAFGALRSPTAEPMPRFGAWQAVRLLGRGGMGTVYLAERADGAFRMSAAVKVVPLALASEEIEERFRRERQFLASLDHPNIARLIDGGLSQHGIPYLVMEFVNGLSIDRFCQDRVVANRDYDNRDCVALIRQLMEALTYIHGQHLVHRDLKPSNVLVDGAGKVKLLDFGTARLVDAGGGDAITKSGVFALTPEYASPEQIAGSPGTFASDIYSAGLLLRKTLPPGKPDRQIELILGKAVQAKPEDRYQSAAEMDLDLGHYLARRPIRVSRSSRRRWLIPALPLSFAIVAVISVALFRQFEAKPESPSIAVLPFTNLSGDPANQYFADGLTDEITDSLAQLNRLRVIARSSAFQIKGKTQDVQEAGRLLNVANVLEGSVQRSGDRVRIIAHLERVSDRSLLWSNTYERKASDLFAIQSELAAGIAASLKIAAGVPSSTHVPNVEAHDFFMKGRYDLDRQTTESTAKAEADYQRAIDLDPAYAAAYAGLASAEYDQSIARGGGYQSEAERRNTEQLSRKALELDPDLSLAHTLQAAIAMQYDWDWGRAEQELRAAVAGPSLASAESYYAFLLTFHGKFAEADRHVRRMMDLDPVSNVTLNNLAQIRNLQGRYAQAREAAQQTLARTPEAIVPQLMIAATYIEESRTELAMPILQRLEPRVPQARLFEAMAFAKTGQRQQALRLLHPFEDGYPNSRVSTEWNAIVYALLGDEPNTLKWLERSADKHEFAAMTIAVHPVYASMRNSPGFRALRKRIGLDW